MRFSDPLRGLAERERALAGRWVVAPLAPGGRLRLAVDGLPLECRVEEEPGWALFELAGGGRARRLREAEPWEREEAEARLPRERLLLFRRGEGSTWWACNPSRRAFEEVHLVEGVDRFDAVLCCRASGARFLVGPDPHADPRRAPTLRRALAERTQPAGLTPLERALLRLAGSPEGEGDGSALGRVLRSLELAGGELVDLQEQDEAVRVTWRKSGRVLTSLLGEDLSVRTAGLCLSGRDAEHDLASLASLVDRPR